MACREFNFLCCSTTSVSINATVNTISIDRTYLVINRYFNTNQCTLLPHGSSLDARLVYNCFVYSLKKVLIWRLWCNLTLTLTNGIMLSQLSRQNSSRQIWSRQNWSRWTKMILTGHRRTSQRYLQLCSIQAPTNHRINEVVHSSRLHPHCDIPSPLVWSPLMYIQTLKVTRLIDWVRHLSNSVQPEQESKSLPHTISLPAQLAHFSNLSCVTNARE